jgi:hypothetical protein
MKLLFQLLGFIIYNLFLYFPGFVIAWDMNPLNWLLLTTSIGRFFLLCFEILFIWIAIDAGNDVYKKYINGAYQKYK